MDSKRSMSKIIIDIKSVAVIKLAEYIQQRDDDELKERFTVSHDTED